MRIEEIEIKTEKLARRVKEINKWIKNNPNTDPNVYEIMDCNIQLAQYISKYRTYHTTIKPIKEISELVDEYPILRGCINEIKAMENLRNIEAHPFLIQEEPKALFSAIKESQKAMDYNEPEDDTMKIIKKELLCKSMSVPFYIWQVHRTEPDYQYDNVIEFTQMNDMLTLYKTDETPQFESELEALFSKIEKDYKYQEQDNSKKQSPIL